MERKYRKKSNLINRTGYTPGYSTEKNPVNFIPSENITMANTPYPLHATPLDQNGNPIGNSVVMQPGEEYKFGGASYVAEIPMFGHGGEKNDWISAKISKLVHEGYPQQQAVAIAYSMYDNTHSNGGYQLPMYEDGVDTTASSDGDTSSSLFGNSPFKPKPTITSPDDFSKQMNKSMEVKPWDYGLGAKPASENILSENYKGTASQEWAKNNPLPEGVQKPVDPNNIFGANVVDNTKTKSDNPNIKSSQPFQFFNQYSGVDIPTAAVSLGQSIENGDTLGTIASGAKLALGTARNIFGGMGQAHRNNYIKQQYAQKQREGMTGAGRETMLSSGGYYQDGGENEEEYDDLINKKGYSNFNDNNAIEYAEVPKQSYSTLAEENTPSYDTNSAADTWQAKTGMPWSEAKRLGYTDGSAKDNMKLLSELNDPRFKKDYLRKSPIKVSTPQLKKQIVKEEQKPQYQTPQTFFKSNPKAEEAYRKANNIRQVDEGDWTDKIANGAESLMEYLGNPIQTFGNVAKYGELPSKGFSKYDQNAYDMVLDFENPFGWGSHAVNAKEHLQQGQYKQAAKEAVGTLPALKALKTTKYIPLYDGLPASGSAARGSKLLSQGTSLVHYQEGGQSIQEEQQEGNNSNPQEENMEQQQGGDITQQIAQALQQGADPQQVIQQLVQMGMPQDQASQLVQQVSQQMQGGTPQLRRGGNYYQDGGEQQIAEQVSQALQQGAQPQQVMQMLIKSGMSQDQAVQLVQAVIQQIQQQGHNSQEESAEGGQENPQEEAMEQGTPQLKKGGIKINPSHKGIFTEQAHKAGFSSPQEFASHVLANSDKYDATTVQRANFAKNSTHWQHQAGGIQSPEEEQQEGANSNPQEEQGEVPQQNNQMQAIMQQVMQMLQQGAAPQQILQQLVQAGVPQQQAQQIVQAAIQQMQEQGHNPQEESAEGGQQNPQEEQMEQGTPQMKNGGKYLEMLKGKTIKDYTLNKKTGKYEVSYE